MLSRWFGDGLGHQIISTVGAMREDGMSSNYSTIYFGTMEHRGGTRALTTRFDRDGGRSAWVYQHQEGGWMGATKAKLVYYTFWSYGLERAHGRCFLQVPR